MSTYTIGIDLGGTSCRVGAFSHDWQRLDSVSMATQVAAGPDAVVGHIADAVRTVIARIGSSRSLAGIGAGSPGPLELPAGRLCHLPNFPGWDNFELKQALEAAIGQPIILESDANAAALAEFLEGAGRVSQVDSMAMLTLGTGVGNGIILKRKIWHGMTGMGGEAGHVPIFPDGPECGCGGRGCLELYASHTGIRRDARLAVANGESAAIASIIDENPDFGAKEIAALAHAGDPAALRIFDHLGYAVGLGLTGLVNTLNLPLYVVGGGLASAWPLFSAAMFRTLHRYSYVYNLSKPTSDGAREPSKTEIVPALLGPGAGLLGAAMLPSNR